MRNLILMGISLVFLVMGNMACSKKSALPATALAAQSPASTPAPISKNGTWTSCVLPGGNSFIGKVADGYSVVSTVIATDDSFSLDITTYETTDCSVGAVHFHYSSSAPQTALTLTDQKFASNFYEGANFDSGKYKGGMGWLSDDGQTLCLGLGNTPDNLTVASLDLMPLDSDTWSTDFSAFIADPTTGLCLTKQ